MGLQREFKAVITCEKKGCKEDIQLKADNEISLSSGIRGMMIDLGWTQCASCCDEYCHEHQPEIVMWYDVEEYVCKKCVVNKCKDSPRLDHDWKKIQQHEDVVAGVDCEIDIYECGNCNFVAFRWKYDDNNQ